MPGGAPAVGAQGLLGPPPAGGAPARIGTPGGGAPGGGASGAPGRGNERQLNQALAYIRSHGGGTLGVSSQQGAAGAILASGTHIAGLGGFSGRESQVSLTWLSSAIGSGRLRWVLDEGGSGPGLPGDTRVGARTALAAVAEVCARVSTTTGASGGAGTTGGTSASGALYDCQGKASALAKLT